MSVGGAEYPAICERALQEVVSSQASVKAPLSWFWSVASADSPFLSFPRCHHNCRLYVEAVGGTELAILEVFQLDGSLLLTRVPAFPFI